MPQGKLLHTASLTKDANKTYVRNAHGELVEGSVFSRFKKPHPLPDKLRAVAIEIMGGEDPINLSDAERERRLHQFLHAVLDVTQNPNG